MKFYSGRQLLHHAASLPLTELTHEDAETTLEIKERKPSGKVERLTLGHSVSHSNSCSTPGVFRKPVSHHGLCRTPFRNRHKLINLSFSQPSSPTTPCLKPQKAKLVCATPFVKSGPSQGVCNDSFVPPTPMIINSLETLNSMSANVDALGIIPDILEIIDDQTEQTETLDRQLKLLSDVELNDDTVVEYLLDLSLEVKSKPTQSLTVQDNHPEHGRVRKKSRYTKVMSEAEREALKHIQKEKSKQRRKQRFREPAVAGTRRSKRIRRPVRSYTPSK